MSERLKEHDWKSCNVKAFAGSNPVLCANMKALLNKAFYFLLCKVGQK